MLNRRAVLAASAAATLLPAPSRAEAPILGDDGLYRQSWFLESFLELKDDLDAAAKANKRLCVMWELRGCPYCKETHLVNFAKPEVTGFIRERFDILQLNIIGSKEVTDFDGQKLSEKALAEKYGVRFTPSFQFFAASSEGLDKKPPREREVARAQGYLQPDHFMSMFRFVSDRAYEKMSLREYLKAQG